MAIDKSCFERATFFSMSIFSAEISKLWQFLLANSEMPINQKLNSRLAVHGSRLDVVAIQKYPKLILSKYDLGQIYIACQQCIYIIQSSLQQLSRMNKFDRIKKKVRQSQKHSILLSLQHSFPSDSCDLHEPNPTIDSESNMTLFPLYNVVHSVEKTGLTTQDSQKYDDGMIIFHQKEQCTPLATKQAFNSPSFRLRDNRSIHFNKTLRNVSQLMAHPIGTKINNPQSKERRLKYMSETHRVTAATLQPMPINNFSLQKIITTKKQKFSPKKCRKSSQGKAKRVVFPKKASSPTKRHEISAWQIPQQQQIDLF